MAIGKFGSSSDVQLYRQNLNLNDIASVLTGTDDPTSVAKSAPQGSVYLRTGASGGTAYVKQDSGSSTNWTELGGGGTGPRSQVILNSGDGYGSSSTRIRRFLNIESTSGSDLTVNQSSTLGDNVTVNTDGLYHIAYCDGTSSGTSETMGISLNASGADLTTNIVSIAAAKRLGVASVVGSANRYACVGVTIFLSASDVIRAHNNGTGIDATAAPVRLQVTMVNT